MPDNTQELQILLRAQNLTQQAFETARKDIEKLGQAAPKTNDALGLLKGGLGALGVAFSATAVVGFAKDVLDTAGNIADLSAALQISTDAVQDFKQGAEDSGATIDDVGRAIQKLSDEAASGSPAFAALGLDIDKVLALSPEDRFRAVANELKAIEDPAVRAARGHDLLGKSYDALAASIDNGIGSMSDSNKMSKETIETLDNLGDSIGHVLTSIKNFGGEFIARAFNDMRSAFKQSGEEFHKTAYALHLDVDGLKNDLSDLYDRFKLLRDGVTNLPKAPSAPSLFKATPSITPTKLSADDIKGIENALNAERKALDETAKAADQHAKKIKEMQDALFGRTAIQNANDYIQALGKFQNLTRLSADDQKKLNAAAKEALEAFQRNGQAATTAIVELYNRTVRMPDAVDGISESVRNLEHEVEVVIPTLYEMPKAIAFTPAALREIEKEAKIAIPEIPKQTKIAKTSLDDMARSIEQLANIAGGSFSSIARDIGSIVGAAATAQTAINKMRDAGKATDKLDGILSMTTGILGIVAAATQAVKAIANLFDRNKGRDLVVDFAETFGGFDELHKKLLELGEEGEALWIKLTQGVGRNNPEQAKAAIEEVTKALEKQKQKTGDVGDVTEEAAAATIETATQASEALKTVGEALETNKGQWSDWSAHVMAEIKSVADSLGAIVIPTPSAPSALPGFAGGTHGAYLDFGAGTPVMLHGRERVMTASEASRDRPIVVNTSVQVEGREIARASSRYQRAVLAPYGVR